MDSILLDFFLCTEKGKHVLQKRSLSIKKIPPLVLPGEYCAWEGSAHTRSLPGGVKQQPNPAKDPLS